MMMDKKHAPTQDNFIQRWSRRKHAQVQQASSFPPDEVSPASPPAPTADIANQTKAFPTDMETLTDADMPALDNLDEHSDYQQFFAKKVSQELRTLALRKLFHHPRFNDMDGLDIYHEDYTQFEPLGDVIPHEIRSLLTQKANVLKENTQELISNPTNNIKDAIQTPKTVPQSTTTTGSEEPSIDTPQTNVSSAIPKAG
ncbi:Protein of unknown function (DUF3306) [Beggiatoa alba B18LD]|uniref:DUF3306 domain-containing protein n=1 Tax=Beggiatoa alba B18LD TaxID=395493 RepID=I3CBG5_9GAMM|nr:DUF3306 domain-containing protein [Beggiatoa alba]EIJ40958.1 Protein of unknown function (DUF3306) [Beggiatoa alba B18LD]